MTIPHNSLILTLNKAEFLVVQEESILRIHETRRFNTQAHNIVKSFDVSEKANAWKIDVRKIRMYT